MRVFVLSLVAIQTQSRRVRWKCCWLVQTVSSTTCCASTWNSCRSNRPTGWTISSSTLFRWVTKFDDFFFFWFFQIIKKRHWSVGINTLSRYLGSLDSYYGTTFLFKEHFWKQQLDCGDGTDIMDKIQNYLMEASNTIQLQIAEAMLSYKEKR